MGAYLETAIEAISVPMLGKACFGIVGCVGAAEVFEWNTNTGIGLYRVEDDDGVTTIRSVRSCVSGGDVSDYCGLLGLREEAMTPQ